MEQKRTELINFRKALDELAAKEDPDLLEAAVALAQETLEKVKAWVFYKSPNRGRDAK